MNPIFLKPNQGEFFSIIGVGVRMLADSTATAGACTIFEAPIPPGEPTAGLRSRNLGIDARAWASEPAAKPVIER